MLNHAAKQHEGLRHQSRGLTLFWLLLLLLNLLLLLLQLIMSRNAHILVFENRVKIRFDQFARLSAICRFAKHFRKAESPQLRDAQLRAVAS